MILQPTVELGSAGSREVGNVGFSVSRHMSVREACSKIVRSAFLHSVDAVVDALSSFLETGTFPMTTVHFLKGVRVPEAIELDQDCLLVPYAEALSLATGLHDRPPSDMRFPTQSRTANATIASDRGLRPSGTSAAATGNGGPWSSSTFALGESRQQGADPPDKEPVDAPLPRVQPEDSLGIVLFALLLHSTGRERRAVAEQLIAPFGRVGRRGDIQLHALLVPSLEVRLPQPQALHRRHVDVHGAGSLIGVERPRRLPGGAVLPRGGAVGRLACDGRRDLVEQHDLVARVLQQVADPPVQQRGKLGADAGAAHVNEETSLVLGAAG